MPGEGLEAITPHVQRILVPVDESRTIILGGEWFIDQPPFADIILNDNVCLDELFETDDIQQGAASVFRALNQSPEHGFEAVRSFLKASAREEYSDESLAYLCRQVRKECQDYPYLLEYLQEFLAEGKYVDKEGKVIADGSRQEHPKFKNEIPTYARFASDMLDEEKELKPKESEAENFPIGSGVEKSTPGSGTEKSGIIDYKEMLTIDSRRLREANSRVLRELGLEGLPYGQALKKILSEVKKYETKDSLQGLSADRQLLYAFYQDYFRIFNAWENSMSQGIEGETGGRERVVRQTVFNQFLAQYIYPSYFNSEISEEVRILYDTVRAFWDDKKPAEDQIPMVAAFSSILNGARVQAGLMRYFESEGYNVYVPDIKNPDEVEKWDTIAGADLVAVKEVDGRFFAFMIDAKSENEIVRGDNYSESMENVVSVAKTEISSDRERQAIARVINDISQKRSTEGLPPPAEFRRCTIYVPPVEPVMAFDGTITDQESHRYLRAQFGIYQYSQYEFRKDYK